MSLSILNYMTKKIDHDLIAELLDEIKDAENSLQEDKDHMEKVKKWVKNGEDKVMDLKYELSKARGEEDDMDDNSADEVVNHP